MARRQMGRLTSKIDNYDAQEGCRNRGGVLTLVFLPRVSRFTLQMPGSQHHPEPCCCRRSSLILPGGAAFSSSRSLRACARAASPSSTASCQARTLNLKLARFPTCSLLPSRLYLLSQRSLSSILANDCGSSIAIALQLIAKFCLSGRISNCRI
jgi:hypothetical protein